MRGLSLMQPRATLVAIGAKRIETRSWTHPYRGVVAIHAAQKIPAYAREVFNSREFQMAWEDASSGEPITINNLPLGAIVAVAEIDTIFRFTDSTLDKIRERSQEGGLPEFEAEFGDYTPGRHGIVLQNVRELAAPVPCRGALSLWVVPTDIEREVVERIPKALVTQ